MPAHSTERYVVYSVDKETNVDDDKNSVSSDYSDNICFRDADYVHLNGQKLLNGNGIAHQLSPSASTTTTDRWGPYWTRRERCCCFWNFLMTAALSVLIAIVILVTKGAIDLQQTGKRSNGSIEKFSSADVTFRSYPCPTSEPQEQECTDDGCVRLSVQLLGKMNVSAEPCEDFYEYACGGFDNTAHVTWTVPRLRANPDVIIQQGMEYLLEQLSDLKQPGESEDKILLKSMFQSCVKHKDTPLGRVTAVINQLGGFGFESDRKKLKRWSITDLVAESLLKFGVSPFFDIDVRQDGRVGINNRFTDKDVAESVANGEARSRYRFLKPSDFIYLDENTDETLQAYKTFIKDLLAYVTQINSTVKEERRFTSMVDEIYHLNVYINRVLYTEETTNLSDGMSKCMNRMSVEELDHNFNYNISWMQLFSYLQRENAFPTNYTVCYISLSNALQDVLYEFSAESIKRYIIFYVLTHSDIFYFLPEETPLFSKRVSQTSALESDMFGTSTMQCARQIYTYLPMSYVIKETTLKVMSDNLLKLFKELFLSLEKILGDLYWVPMKQKKHLMTVLNELSMQFDWTKRVSLKQYFKPVTDIYFDNLIKMMPFKMRHELRGYKQRIHSNTDSSIFSMMDSILNVPLLATQMPFVEQRDIDSLWYGSVGTLVAQPMSELFDIDAWLNFLTNDKIDHSVALTIAHRLQCLVAGYNDYFLHAGEQVHYVRGDLTKSANFKDSLALRVAHNGYSKSANKAKIILPGLHLTSDQMFFLTYAQTMCEKVNTKGTYQYYINTEDSHHAPGKYRTMGTLKNFKPFSDAFKCKSGSTMNPKTKCSLF